MNPNQEKKNTLPYMLRTFKIGIERAFLLTGLTSGAMNSIDGENISNI